MRLSAICAPAAGVGRFSLLAILVYVADEDPAVCAGVGAQALETGVVRLYSVVVILSGWVRVGCARLFGVHSEPPSSVGQVPGCSNTCGTTSLFDTLIIRYCFRFVYAIVLEFDET